MELSLQPQAAVCFVTQQPFEDGLRVASYLVRMPESGEIARRDLLEREQANYQPEGPVICRWVRAYKKRAPNENPERELKLTAESLFLTLADPATERTEDTTRLLQFLALMLERKRVLRPKGRTADGANQIFEHAKSKELYEVPVGELTPEFFAGVQEQLGVLVGGK
ncbi:hypothetical protein OH491_22550 [Termitidicoccus mucosus]|uniref:Uncharacterized protein n=1 Tax=Termitidicoccus mucosus TaxID=1184151 RepID=A0A178IPX4_9BACT|nr:hypothetical protein AW736_03930 [Opitutaceae bacterium TSB47]